MRDLRVLLTRQAVVTVTGTGGVGKTRTALEVAAATADQYLDGTWFIDLSHVHDPKRLVHALATVFDVASNGPDGLFVLTANLTNRHLLIVLDNCEHLIIEVARVVNEILHRAPSVRVLATSRQRLGLAGEVEFQLPILAVPAPTIRPEKALLYDSITLFEDRAKLAAPTFRLTEELVPLVAEICRRLDGCRVRRENPHFVR